MASSRYGPLVFTPEVDRRETARAVGRGVLVRLGPGIYTGETGRPPEDVVRAYLWRIVAHEIPGAVIADRSVRDGGTGRDGRLYVVGARARPLALPGVTVVPRQGPGRLVGDMALPDGLSMSGDARALLDNLAPTRRDAHGHARTLSRAEVEDWIDLLRAQRGEDGLNAIRDEARALAPLLGRERQVGVLDGLIGAALNTRTGVRLSSPALISRAAGQAADQQRLAKFVRLAATLTDEPPSVLPALPEDQDRRALLPFYEAYFSNFIEGTEFTLDEAAEIVFDDRMPSRRPRDAHDVLGTYRIASDSSEMRRTAGTGEEFLEILRRRHAVMMGARPEASPGEWKQRANRAGSTEFVAPELVTGTLLRGFEAGRGLRSPFARAVFMMFLVSEVHPFTDGNGRIARLMMNAELVCGGELRIIVPTVYRLNYLSALKAATHTANDAALIATLTYARRWTARVNFTNREIAEADLARTHALRDALEAEEAGVRLTLP